MALSDPSGLRQSRPLCPPLGYPADFAPAGPPGCLFHDVRVDHGRFEVSMAQKRLDRADIVAILVEMRREAVPEGVTGDPFRQPCPAGPAADRPLDRHRMDMPSSTLSGHRMPAELGRRENVLSLEHGDIPAMLNSAQHGR